MAKRRQRAVIVKSEPVEPGTPETIQRAWRLLAGGAPIAAQSLINIAANGHSEVARVQASMTILDRVNLGARNEVVVRAVPVEFDQGAVQEDTALPSAIIARRLEQLAIAQEAGQPTPDFGEKEIVDAELVEPWEGPAEQNRPLKYGESGAFDEQY